MDNFKIFMVLLWMFLLAVPYILVELLEMGGK